jgi:hypothetical protein
MELDTYCAPTIVSTASFTLLDDRQVTNIFTVPISGVAVEDV